MDVEVVGVASDGTEIVYAEEAVSTESVAAPTDLLRASENASRRARRKPKRAPPPRAPIVAAARGDSLGTTTGRLPNVRQVTRKPPPPDRQAHEPLPVARRSRSHRPPVATTPANAVSEYQRLVAVLRSGRHAAAIAGFRRFVARYPKSDYADNAQYWLGEAYYDQKKFADALREFQRVAVRFPNGNKVSDAILKTAFCQLNLGKKAGAIAALERLIAEFPDSRPATLARQKLGRLRE